jgi:hypothetical protein
MKPSLPVGKQAMIDKFHVHHIYSKASYSGTTPNRKNRREETKQWYGIASKM